MRDHWHLSWVRPPGAGQGRNIDSEERRGIEIGNERDRLIMKSVACLEVGILYEEIKFYKRAEMGHLFLN